MTFRRIKSAPAILLMMALIASCGSVWASSANCAYPRSGTGMGGTGTIARGTGIGGTGISPEAASAMQLAGNVILSQGNVEAQRDGNARRLAQGDAVCVGETIVTSQSGTVKIRMADDAMIAIRPLTQLKIKKYVYGGTANDGSLLALLNGSGRFVTGKIGKAHPQDDLIETPNATIGVRGTDHEATVILPNAKAGYPSGTYDKVNSGITFIRTEKGEIDIHPSQAGFAANIGEAPTILKEMPVFYSTNPAMRQEGSPAKEKMRDEGLGENKKVDRPVEQSSEEPRSDKPAETGSPPDEHSDRHGGMEHPEHPEHPELPRLPEHPELPGTLEHFELPGTPERPDVPGQTDN